MQLYDYFKKTLSKNRVLAKNFSSLSILQISQYIFPLVTFPYLVRVLGPDGYGLVAFATAFVGYFTVFTDYGFNLSATREVSIHRKDPHKISNIFNSVLSIKLILFTASIIIFLPIVYAFARFNQDIEIYLISFVSVLGTTLFPVWFFQGTERMGFITFINVLVKAVWVIAVFVFVQSRSDILLLVALNSLSSLLVGIIGLIVVKYYFNLTFSIPSIENIKLQFVEGWHYFLSTASISLYTLSNVFILGLFASDTIVGYFSAADKIRHALQNITDTAGRTIFPYLSAEFKRSKVAAFIFLRKFIKIVGSILIVSCLLLFIFSEPIVYLILGVDYVESIILLKIISFLPLIIFFSNVAGVQTMLNLGFKRDFANIILISGILNIIISFIVVPVFLSIGSAIMVLFTEILVTSQMVIFLRKNDINIFKSLLNNS